MIHHQLHYKYHWNAFNNLLIIKQRFSTLKSTFIIKAPNGHGKPLETNWYNKFKFPLLPGP
jgi:hypothetical protein